MENKLEIINPDDEFYYDSQLWEVGIYPGAGAELKTFLVYAPFEQKALEIAVANAEQNAPGLLINFNDVETLITDNYQDDYKEWLEDNFGDIKSSFYFDDDNMFDFITNYLNYIYVDATEEGASEPYFVTGDNLVIRKVDKEESNITESIEESADSEIKPDMIVSCDSDVNVKKVEESNITSEHVIWDSEFQLDAIDLDDLRQSTYQEYLDEFDSHVEPMDYEQWLDSDDCATYFDLEWEEMAKQDAYYSEWYEFISNGVSEEEKKDAYEDYVERCKNTVLKPKGFEAWLDDNMEELANNHWEIMSEDLDYNIIPEIDSQLNDNILLISGYYGSNYPEFSKSGEGGKLFEKGTDEFVRYMDNFDRVQITTQDGQLGTVMGDHDGTISGVFYTLPDDKTELIKAMGYEDRIKEDYSEEDLDKYNHNDLMETEFNNDLYYGGIDARDLTQHLNLLKPIKDTISAYGPKTPDPDGTKTESKITESVDNDFVDNAYDLIADYVYGESNRDEVEWSEIKDYIYNDVCDDMMSDYNPSKETMEAIKDRLIKGGYKVLDENKEIKTESTQDEIYEIAKNTNIKEWYIAEYPDDELGANINDVTFYDLFVALDTHKNIYDVLGVGDSVVRERVFKKLDTILEEPAGYCYDQWLLTESKDSTDKLEESDTRRINAELMNNKDISKRALSWLDRHDDIGIIMSNDNVFWFETPATYKVPFTDKAHDMMIAEIKRLYPESEFLHTIKDTVRSILSGSSKNESVEEDDGDLVIVVEFWETEEDREEGLGSIYDYYTESHIEDAIAAGEKLVADMNYAAVEVYHEKDGLTYYLYDSENGEQNFGVEGKMVGLDESKEINIGDIDTDRDFVLYKDDDVVDKDEIIRRWKEEKEYCAVQDGYAPDDEDYIYTLADYIRDVRIATDYKFKYVEPKTLEEVAPSKKETIENAIIPTIVDCILDGKALTDKKKDYVETDGEITAEEFDAIYDVATDIIKKSTDLNNRGNIYMDVAKNYFKIDSEHNHTHQEPGICPVCGNDNLEYTDTTLEGNSYGYRWDCHKCETAGYEWYVMSFDEIVSNTDDAVSHKEGQCPVCDSDLNYDSLVPDGMDAYYEVNCDECDFIGKEYYTLTFDGHEIISRKTESDEITPDLKQEFIAYCEGKVSNLGEIQAVYSWGEDSLLYPVELEYDELNISWVDEPIKNAKLILTDDISNVCGIVSNGKVVAELGEDLAPQYIACEMNFSRISKDLYEMIISEWDNLHIADNIKAHKENGYSVFTESKEQDEKTVEDMADTFVKVMCDNIKMDLDNMDTTEIASSEIDKYMDGYNHTKNAKDLIISELEQNGYTVLTESKRYTIHDYAQTRELGPDESRYAIYDAEKDDFYYDNAGNNPVFDNETDAQKYIDSLTESKELSYECPQCGEEIEKLVSVDAQDLSPEELDSYGADSSLKECPECGYRTLILDFQKEALDESKDGLDDIDEEEYAINIYDETTKEFIRQHDCYATYDEAVEVAKDLKLADNETYSVVKIMYDENGDELGVDTIESKETLNESDESGTLTFDLHTDLVPILNMNQYNITGDYEVPRDELDELMKKYAEPIITEEIVNVFPSAKVTFGNFDHPKYYRAFSNLNDTLDFTVTVSAEEYEAKKQSIENTDEFATFLKDNFKSYDGFISHMADNLKDFQTQDDWKQFVSVLTYFIKPGVRQEEFLEELTDYIWGNYPTIDEIDEEDTLNESANPNESIEEQMWTAVCSDDRNFVKNAYNKDIIKPNTRYVGGSGTHSFIMGALRNRNFEMVDLLKSFGERILKVEVDEYKNIMAEREYEDETTKTAMEESHRPESKWSEIKAEFFDEEENVYCVDAWTTADDNEEGTVIAKVNPSTKEVIYLDDDAKTDSYAQEIISGLLEETKALTEKVYRYAIDKNSNIVDGMGGDSYFSNEQEAIDVAKELDADTVTRYTFASETDADNREICEDAEEIWVSDRIKADREALAKEPKEEKLFGASDEVIADSKAKGLYTESKKDWFGINGAEYIWRGEWSDPQVSYKGYLYNYWDIEEYVGDSMQSEYEEKGEQAPDDVNALHKYMENNPSVIECALLDLTPDKLNRDVISKLENNYTFDGLIADLNELKSWTNIPEDKIDECIKVANERKAGTDFEDAFDEEENVMEIMSIIESILSEIPEI